MTTPFTHTADTTTSFTHTDSDNMNSSLHETYERNLHDQAVSAKTPEYNTPLGVGHVEVSYGLDNLAMLSELLPFRDKFIKRMRWEVNDEADLAGTILDGVPDADRYDLLGTTLHLSSMNRQTGEIIAGLRFTPVESVEESLSWGMLRENPRMQDQILSHEVGRQALARLNESAARGHLWDLTRLVNPLDQNADHAQIAAAMMELFGTGHGIIRKEVPEENYEDIYWIFNTTERLKDSLISLGVSVTQLAGDVVNGEHDEEKSFFCVVEPEKNVHFISDNPLIRDFTCLHMQNGLKKANAL